MFFKSLLNHVTYPSAKEPIEYIWEGDENSSWASHSKWTNQIAFLTASGTSWEQLKASYWCEGTH